MKRTMLPALLIVLAFLSTTMPIRSVESARADPRPHVVIYVNPAPHRLYRRVVYAGPHAVRVLVAAPYYRRPWHRRWYRGRLCW